MKWIQKVILGQRPSSSKASNFRRGFSRFCIGYIALMLIEVALASYLDRYTISASWGIILVIGSLTFFTSNVLAIPLLAKQDFRPNPERLFGDILISSILTILAFSQLYRWLGIENDGVAATDARDFVYFSMVTFSTLGFGDFVPSANTRLFAGTQAMVGNLHLGMLVGTLFIKAQQKG